MIILPPNQSSERISPQLPARCCSVQNHPQARPLSAIPSPPSLIKHLPGYGRPEEPQYAGFVNIEEKTNSNLFYWLIQNSKQLDIAESPLIIWLQGGPGASSLYGLLRENVGPYTVNEDLKLTPNTHSWHHLAHLMFVDYPVGTGFSYTNCPKRYVRNDAQGAQDFLQFLVNFYKQYPAFRKCGLFIAGESYAGKYIPAIADRILAWNEAADCCDDLVNLSGVILCSPWIHPEAQTPAYTEHAYRHGRLSEDQKRYADELMEECIRLFRQGEMLKSTKLWDEAAEYIYKCGGGFSPYDVRDTSGTDELPGPMDRWLAVPDVRKALHAGDHVWNEDNGVKVFEMLRESDMVSSLPYLQRIVKRTRVLVFNGQYDWVCNHIGVETLLERHLIWEGKDEFFRRHSKRDWHVNGELAGYYRVAGRLMHVVVMDAGHMVPEDQPENAFRLIEHFLKGGDLKMC